MFVATPILAAGLGTTAIGFEMDNYEDFILDTIEKKGICTLWGDAEFFSVIDDLIVGGFILCCLDIPHHPKMVNPSYTFVENSEEGRQLALTDEKH